MTDDTTHDCATAVRGEIVRQGTTKFTITKQAKQIRLSLARRIGGKTKLSQVSRTLKKQRFSRYEIAIERGGYSPVCKRNKRIDLGIFGKKPENLYTGSVFHAEED